MQSKFYLKIVKRLNKHKILNTNDIKEILKKKWNDAKLVNSLLFLYIAKIYE
jgi:hypothetical protein